MSRDDIDMRQGLQILPEEESFLEKAKKMAAHMGINCLPVSQTADPSLFLLRLGEKGLSLTGGGMELQGDFQKMEKRIRPGNLQSEFLIKVSKIKGASRELTAVDATAGMGEDAFLLAAAGFRVYLYEYNPVIAALLRDALKRAGENPLLSKIAERMVLCEENSIEAMPRLPFYPDVILLDPMFPERQKTASVKKKFQLLQNLESPCLEEKDLLQAAIAAGPRKIMIKRPLKGPFLAGRKPDYSISGKAIRYDCLVFAGNQKNNQSL